MTPISGQPNTQNCPAQVSPLISSVLTWNWKHSNFNMFFSVFHCTRQIPKALGCKNNPLAYDITAACSGFVLGLVSASCHIRGNKLVYFAAEKVPTID